jgi:L-ribulokinase
MFWSEDWGGFPPESFFEALDPALVPILRTLNANKYTCDKPYGKISSALAAELGLSCDVVIGCGNVDSHQGAIGAGVAYKRAMINLGTSGCCMFVIPSEVLGGRIIDGVFGQAESCIIPGLVGFEVGLSAFGDAYAWLRRTLAYPTVEILAKSEKIDPETRKVLVDEVLDNILVKLGEDAAKITPRLDAPFATDWFNGRRSPEPNQLLWGSLMGLKLSTTAPELYYAIVEATALAMKTIVDHLAERDIVFDSFIGVGGISQKSPFVCSSHLSFAHTITRPGYLSNICLLWVTITIAVPFSLFMLVRSCMIPSAVSGSRFPVGSSPKRTVKSGRIARAKASLCC